MFLKLLLLAAVIAGVTWWARRAPTVATRALLSTHEAASVLGVSTDATREEILAAHRRLIRSVHPDRGGSDYLARQINDARDTLLKERR